MYIARLFANNHTQVTLTSYTCVIVNSYNIDLLSLGKPGGKPQQSLQSSLLIISDNLILYSYACVLSSNCG